jgi:hypothetical protein
LVRDRILSLSVSFSPSLLLRLSHSYPFL